MPTATPLTVTTAAVLRDWLAERRGGPGDPVFPGRRGEPLSRYGVALVVARHASGASAHCPSLAMKKVSPHILRHTAAMRLLHAGVGTSVIALWLRHEGTRTTQIYVHAALTLKERALARTAPVGSRTSRYRPPDRLLAFLESL